MHGNHRLATESGGDEFAHLFGQVADVADGAGAGAFGGTEGLADLIGDIGFAVARGFGGLNKHLLPYMHVYPDIARQ